MTSSIRHGAASARGPRRPLDVVTALAATALLIGPGMMLFAWPPGADEARLQLWARALSGGAVFYRDLWDGTQPGLAWFYQLGHALPAGELGPRILLLVLVLVAGRLLYGAMSRAHAHPLTRAFGPAAVFAPVLLLGERGGVGHVEGVVVALLVPQVVLTGLLDDPDDRMPSGRRRWSLAATWGTAGVFAGILAVFEVTYLSISGVLLTGAVALAWRRGAGRERLTGGLLGYVAGATAPIGAALGYLTWHGVAGAAWHAAVTLRVAAWSEGVSGEPVRALLSALPLLTLPVLACLVAAEALARHRQVRRRWLPAGVTFAAALLAAVVCLALPGSGAQAGPLLAGIIAVPALLGLDALARRPSPALVATLAGDALVVAAGLAPRVVGTAVGALGAAQAAIGSPSSGTVDVRPVDAADDRARAQAAAVTGSVAPGSGIYVLGDPRIYRLLHATPAVPVTVRADRPLPAPARRELEREFACAEPAYVFVDHAWWPAVRSGAPEVAARLGAGYERLADSGGGTWWRRADSGEGSVRLLRTPAGCTPLHATW